MTEREFAYICYRALMMVVKALEKRYNLGAGKIHGENKPAVATDNDSVAIGGGEWETT